MSLNCTDYKNHVGERVRSGMDGVDCASVKQRNVKLCVQINDLSNLLKLQIDNQQA